MTTFWLFAAALLVIALAMLLPPLLRPSDLKASTDRRAQNVQIAKDAKRQLDDDLQRGVITQSEHRQATDELELSLFSDVDDDTDPPGDTKKQPAVVTALAISIVVPLASVLIYYQIGHPQAITVPQQATVQDPNQSLAAMVDQLEARLARDPRDIDGWKLLGRTYMAEKEYAKAEKAFTGLLAMAPDNAEYMLLKADAMAMNAGGRTAGEPARLIVAALEIDPNNFTGLWLAGIAARENNDPDTALKHWTKLQGLLPPDSQDLRDLNQLIAQLKAPATEAGPLAAADIETLVAKLEQRLADNPDNPQGWLMLGRSYMVMQKFPDAVRAFDEALNRNPDSADVKLALADSLTMRDNGRMTDRAIRLVDEALAEQPENPKALWLAGMAAREREETEQAIAYWERLLPIVADDPASTADVETMIAEARGETPPTSASQGVVPAVTSASITLRVSLDDTLTERAQPDDTVFIYVKAFEGPPMPLAAARHRVRDLPLTITLDDTMAMMPQLSMSSFDQWTVGARISSSGEAIATSGDLYAERGPVLSGDNVGLQIDQIMP